LWLRFYLSRDEHPEPKLMLFLTYMGGGLTVIASLLVYSVLEDTLHTPLGEKMINIATTGFVGLFLLAAIEEIMKYLPPRIFSLRTKVLDEPIDFIVYMVVSGLGFAAAENIFYIIGEMSTTDTESAVALNVLRSFTAIMMHALSSGIFGYILAIGLLKGKNMRLWWCYGLIASTLLHTTFNYFILSIGDLVLILILLLLSAFFLLEAIQYLKNLNINYIIKQEE
jgi:RsiW-degrading membrane proteinase PrsW (M82 family)